MRRAGSVVCAEWRVLSRERGCWLLLAMLAALVLYGAQAGIAPPTAGTIAGPLAGMLLPAMAALALARRALRRFPAFTDQA